jgi:hypothetical protein
MGDVQIRLVGFFRSAAEVSVVAMPSAQRWEPAAIRYLENGRLLVQAFGGMTSDLLNPDGDSIGFHCLRTDGLWVWPGELAFYLRTYHVLPPVDFIHRMASQDWEIPDLDQEAIRATIRGLDPYYGNENLRVDSGMNPYVGNPSHPE